MNKFFFLIFLFSGSCLLSQTRLSDGSWEDKELSFDIVNEGIKEDGFIELCISKNGFCVENLTIGFTIVIFDKTGKEIWNSLWTGKDMELKFERSFPEAEEILIEAGASFVINKTTGTRIGTGQPLKLVKNLN